MSLGKHSCLANLSLKLFLPHASHQASDHWSVVKRLLSFSVLVHVLSYHFFPALLHLVPIIQYALDCHLYCSCFETLPFLLFYCSIILGHSGLHNKNLQSPSAESLPFYLQLTQSPCSALCQDYFMKCDPPS